MRLKVSFLAVMVLAAVAAAQAPGNCAPNAVICGTACCQNGLFNCENGACVPAGAAPSVSTATVPTPSAPNPISSDVNSAVSSIVSSIAPSTFSSPAPTGSSVPVGSAGSGTFVSTVVFPTTPASTLNVTSVTTTVVSTGTTTDKETHTHTETTSATESATESAKPTNAAVGVSVPAMFTYMTGIFYLAIHSYATLSSAAAVTERSIAAEDTGNAANRDCGHVYDGRDLAGTSRFIYTNVGDYVRFSSTFSGRSVHVENGCRCTFWKEPCHVNGLTVVSGFQGNLPFAANCWLCY